MVLAGGGCIFGLFVFKVGCFSLVVTLTAPFKVGPDENDELGVALTDVEGEMEADDGEELAVVPNEASLMTAAALLLGLLLQR